MTNTRQATFCKTRQTVARATHMLKKVSILCALLAAAIAFLPLIAAIAAAQDAAPSYTVLYNFTGGADGGVPQGGLIRDAAGNLFGTTYGGGNTGNSCPFGSAGCGVVFSLDPSGKETVLYTFSGGADGSEPYSGSLIRDAAGNLYGTTSGGGNTGSSCPNGAYGCGVVFKLTAQGRRYKVLYTFTGGADGSSPQSGLIRDKAGNLYGTTTLGGNTTSSCVFGTSGCGVVFRVDPSGKETVLYAFTGGKDGSNSYGTLIRDAAGNLYGTTSGGGNTSSSCPNGAGGCGVVFKLSPSGKETVLHAFTGGKGGAFPIAGLARDATGTLYGTAPYGGNCALCGVVFKLKPRGQHYQQLYAFTAGSDGFNPFGGAVLDRACNLYGAAFGGGTDAHGVIYSLDGSGKYTLLHTFNGTDGGGPIFEYGLLYKGSLYGTASAGGNSGSACGGSGCGVVFKVTP